jgi:exosome complex component RRP4
MKSHFQSLPFGVDLILGMNGYIWVCKHVPQHPDQADSESIYSNANEPISDELRLLIAHVCRAISLLGRYHWYITDSVIRHVLSCPEKLRLSEKDFLREALKATEAQ